VILAAVKLGIGVWVPASGDARHDMIFDHRSPLARVQCKTAVQLDDVLLIRLYSSRRCTTGLRKCPYSTADADAVAAYSPTQQRCYFLELSEVEGHMQVSLRLGRTCNNQAAGIRWAHDYEFAARLTPLPGP